MERNHKILLWLGIVALLAWWMWASGQGAAFNAVTGLDFQVLSLGAFLLLIAALVLGYILFRQRRWALATSAIVGLFFLIFYGWTGLNLIAVGIFLLFNLWSANRVRREMIERKILNIPDAFYHGLTPVVFGLFVMFSFAAYQSSWADQISRAGQLPSQTQVFFQQIVDKTVGQKIQGGTPDQRQAIINEIGSQTFQEFNALLKPYFQYAPPVLAFGLFLILSGLSFIFIWVGMVVGVLLYWILKKTRVIRVEEHETKAQVLVV